LAPSNEVVVADFATQRELFRMPTGHRGNLSAFAVAPDLLRLVTAADDGSVFVWDARQGAQLFALEGHTGGVNGITFSLDNRRIVTASADGTARVWDDSGRLLKTLAVGQNVFIGVISPDSRWIAISDFPDQNAIWSLESGQLVRTLPHRAGGVFNFAWTADSRRVVSAGWDMVARVWDASSGRLLAQCQGHTFPIWSIALSPDGARLVTGSMDRTARVWDVATGYQLLTLTGHTSDVHSVAWSADGRQIVTGSDDQTMKIWEAATPEDLAAWQAEEAEAARRLALPRETARQ
jgi:WD40 repeat protein